MWICRSMVPRNLSVAPSAARLASAGPGRSLSSCSGNYKHVRIELSDEPESISAIASFPSIVVQRHGKLFREVWAAVIIGRSVCVEFLLVFRQPPPGASFPRVTAVLHEFSAASADRRARVGKSL